MGEQTVETPSVGTGINTPVSNTETSSIDLRRRTDSTASDELQFYDAASVPNDTTDGNKAKGSGGDSEEHSNLSQQPANIEVWQQDCSDRIDQMELFDYYSDNADQQVASGLIVPITSRDLFNATPRPSPRGTPRTSLSEVPSLSPSSKNIEQSSSSALDPRKRNSKSLDNSLDVVTVSFGRLDVNNQPNRNDQPTGYDVSKEELPAGTFFDQGIQDALKSAKKLAGSIDDQLSQCALAHTPNSDLYKIREAAKKHRNFDCPAKRTIGITGNSGEGKSSLINSLLDVPNLAKKVVQLWSRFPDEQGLHPSQGDNGNAVTSVVTEYRRRTPQHIAPFTIEADFSNEEEIQNQLYELLLSYRAVFSLDQNEDVLEYQHLEKESEVALSTLQSIFPGKPETSPENLRVDFEVAYTGLKRLASGLRWPAGASTAANAKECSDKVAEFMKDGLWPFTDVIRIYLQAQVLKNGIVLADLPGTRDVNLARVKKTEEYLLRCDELFVVAGIRRILSDPSVHNLVHQYSGSVLENVKRIVIVCTHADVVDDDKKCYPSVVDLPETKSAKEAVDAAYMESPTEFEVARLRYNQIFMKWRNNQAKEGLMKKCAKSDRADNLNIFCVGNKDYEGSGYWGPETRIIAAEGSGIPDLRRFCHSVVAKAQFRATINFLDVEMHGLIQKLEVWIAALDQVAIPEIPRDCVANLQLKIEENVEACRHHMKDRLETQIIKPMTMSDENFNDGAITVSNKWKTTLVQQTYKAFCRGNGEHTNRDGKYSTKNWNADIIMKMKEMMEKPWSTLMTEVEHAKELEESLEQPLSILHGQMRGKSEDLKVTRKLLRNFETKQREITRSIRAEVGDFRRNLEVIRRNALGTDSNSFVLQTMLPAYESCRAEKGTGMERRMHENMEHHMEQRRIFSDIRDLIRNSAEVLLDEMTDKINEHVQKMCDDIDRQIKVIQGDELPISRSHPRDMEIVRETSIKSRKAFDDLWMLVGPAREEIPMLDHVG